MMVKPNGFVLAGCLAGWLVAHPAVSAATAPPPSDCGARTMNVRFQRSGGFAGITVNRTLDTDSMSADDAATLCRLVDAAGFFELPTKMLDTSGADQFVHHVTIEADGKRHTVEASGQALPPALNDLLSWLDRNARRARRRS